MAVGQNIINWARGKMGKQVGDGECWTLVNTAAISGGAHGSEHYGTIGNDVEYVWGKEVDMTAMQPGDLIQARDHYTTWAIETTIIYPGDKWTNGGDSYNPVLPRPHHSMIATALPDKDGVIATIEQNIDPKGMVVQKQKLHTRDVPTVTTKKIQSVPHPDDPKKKIQATVITETTITVEGTLTVFRPEKR